MTDRLTDGRTPDRYIMLTARRGQRKNLTLNFCKISDYKLTNFNEL